MDKYEFNLKVEQIKKLAAKKEFEEAAKIAKGMNWQKVKDWPTLATVLNVQETVGDYEEARDMAILAYNRNLGGRKLIYKLTELLIKVKDFDNADMLYEEYAKVSQHDVNRYILQYNLRKAENASDNELVEILEEYKEKEIDEKYMYELAKLYYKTNRKEECIQTCDNIVLWFQDGIYVEKSVKLKDALNGSLTGIQKKILDDANNRNGASASEKDVAYAKQQEIARLKKDDIDDALNENQKTRKIDSFADVTNKSEDDEDDLGFLKGNDGDSVEVPVSTSGSKSSEVNYEPLIKSEDDSDGPISIDLVQNNQNNELKDYIINAINSTAKQQAEAEAMANLEQKLKESEELQVNVKEPDEHISVQADVQAGMEKESDTVSDINKASSSLKELIENAKKQLNENYEQMNRQDEEEDRREAVKKINEKADSIDIEVNIPNYSVYDTQRIQLELAQNLSDIFSDENIITDEAVNVLHPSNDDAKATVQSDPVRIQAPVAVYQEQEINPEDEQIEGQLSIMDWMDSVKEEKYGKQHTKEFSRAELERILDEKDEKSAAYERIMAKQKADALEAGKAFDEETAKRNAEAAMILASAKTDLAIRTGKASAKLEQYFGGIIVKNEQHNTEEETVKAVAQPVLQVKAEGAETKQVKVEAQPVKEAEEVPLVTASIPAISDEIINNVRQILNESSEETTRKIKSEDVLPTREDRYNEDESKFDSDKKLTGELAKIFKKYREMPGIEEQLVDLFDSYGKEMAVNTSATGNILISGNSSSDKTDLARSIVRALNYLYPDKQKKLAKTTGESINQRGITKAMSKLRGTALIVEGAGVIQPKRINELINCLEQDTDRMIVILEDSDAEMNVLVNFNPELTNVFNYRIVLKQYTVNEHVEMAKRFARKRQYEVDDDALLELYLKIDKLHGMNDNISLDDIKEIINKAIENSERRAARRFFGGLKKKRGENGDVIFLTEADFKDR